MISKELLSEVLNLKICIDDANPYIQSNMLVYDVLNNDEINTNNINIYELAHKCKEWACKQKKVNMFFVETDIENSEINVGILYGEHHPNLNMHYFNEDNCEIKSIIKACQWILDNKEDS